MEDLERLPRTLPIKVLPLPSPTEPQQIEHLSLSTTTSHPVTVLSLAQGLGVDFLPLTTLQFLDGPDVARAGRTNRFLYRASLNEGVWQAVRGRLWKGKVFVAPQAKEMLSAKAAYIESLADSRRTWLGQEELTTFSWWFRFKQQAGEAWTAQDPWYRNEKAPTVEFRDDHTVLRHGEMSLPPQADMSWRFVQRTGSRTGPSGSFLRVSIGGREVPTYIVSRHPSNWGFLLESCWTLYTSWEMPPRDGPGSDRSLLDDKLKVTMDDQWEEAMSFNTGLSFEIYDLGGLGNEDSDDEEDDDSNDDANSFDGAIDGNSSHTNHHAGNGGLGIAGGGGGGGQVLHVPSGDVVGPAGFSAIVPAEDEDFLEDDSAEENRERREDEEEDDDASVQSDDYCDAGA